MTVQIPALGVDHTLTWTSGEDFANSGIAPCVPHEWASPGAVHQSHLQLGQRQTISMTHPDHADVLTAIEISKSYGKSTRGRWCQSEVRPGEIVGLLGPNGAGKTTTLAMLSTYWNRIRARC